MCKIIPILEPKSVIPFAGSYIIGGKNYYKNNYLGTTTWDECADFLKQNLKFKINVVTLRENQTFDILNQLQLEKYERLDLDDMKKYIESIKDHKYEYEKDDEPDISKLVEDSELASKKMSERLKRFNAELNTNVFIQIKDKSIQIIKGKDEDRKLFCELDNKLLRRILDRKAHWNNAEIGTHITFKRYPNKMEPDTHTLMSFFHL